LADAPSVPSVEMDAANTAATALTEVGVAGRALARSWDDGNSAATQSSTEAIASAHSAVHVASQELSAGYRSSTPS